jgi:ParB family chromosome partitioning protein
MKHTTKAATAPVQDPSEEVDIPVGNAESNAQARSQSPTPMVTRLDPRHVFPGTGPNRVAQAYETEAFEKLCESIKEAGGNTTPIEVITLAPDQVPPGSEYKYILISGSRRLRACLETRQRVLAVVDLISELPPEVRRTAENQLRESTSAIEVGRQVQEALRKNPNYSKRALARVMGYDSSQLMRALDVADLPASIVDCFPSPIDIRYDDGPRLKQALAAAPEAVLAAVEEIRMTPGMKAAEVVRRIVEAAAAVAATPSGKLQKRGDESFITPLEIDGQPMGELKQDKAGRQVITLEIPLTAQHRDALNRVLQRFVREKVLGHKKPRTSAKAMPQQADTPAEGNIEGVAA